MSETIQLKKYVRKVNPLERIFNRSPYAIVTMVARIKGNISENLLKDAVCKVQQRHLNLRVRIYEDNDHNLWFASEGVKEIPIDIVARESDEHWIDVYHEACKIPFDFEERPAIRFILLFSPEISELIILCHHIICDGMSLAYLARDIMTHLGDPTREVEVLPDPVPMDKDNLPQEVSINAIVKYFINRMSKKWKKDEIYFDQEDYKNLNEAYWKRYKHQVLPIELSETQTSALVNKCRKEGVTVNTALTAAFAGAQSIIQGNKANPNIAIGGNVRDRLLRPAGEAMGYFAGGINLKYKYNSKANFWDNARKLHQKVKPLYTNKNLFKELLPWCYLEPGIMESLCYKMIGELVPTDSPRYNKLSAFSNRNDVVASILKREKMDSLDKPFLGTAMTNLTRLDFPKMYGPLELDRLIMNPGGMFPLAIVSLVVGAVTCAGKLSLLLEYAEETIDSKTMGKIKEKALEFLLNE
ncbi:MAG: condensation domain-containing protein [Candidatus Hodarchaeota archaeon]